MDGHFVPNLTIGAPVIRSLRKHTKGYLDCHLMVSHPEKWVSDFAKAGANGFTFHIEATEDPIGLLSTIHDHGMRAGIALKPSTPLASILTCLESKKVDLVLIMTVEPGFGGQSFLSEPLTKVRTLRAMHPDLNIQVDGGVSLDTIHLCAHAGANVYVAGSAIYGTNDRKTAIQQLRAKALESLNCNLSQEHA
ncbi:hypothetical protein HMI54_011732 [Coelomomyces lativittatus]|nr:hypothetical protein HMI54_011732 [Coelomomyces lativittatus]